MSAGRYEVLGADWGLLPVPLSSLALSATEGTFLSPALGLLCPCLNGFGACSGKEGR